MRHLLTLAEMTSFLNSRNDISPAVKAKILSGDSCTSPAGMNALFAVQAYASARWQDVEYKTGLPGAARAAAPSPPLSATTSGPKAKGSSEPRYVCNGVTLTVSQIRAKLASDDLDSEDIVVRIGGDGDELRIREVDELIRRTLAPAPATSAAARSAPPVTNAPAVAAATTRRSRIAAAGMRAYCDELSRESEDDAADAPARSRAVVASRASQTSAFAPSKIAARGRALAEASTEHDDGPEAA
jgi:hypothetical protein